MHPDQTGSWSRCGGGVNQVDWKIREGDHETSRDGHVRGKLVLEV